MYLPAYMVWPSSYGTRCVISSALRNFSRSSRVRSRISRRTYLHMSGMPVIAPTMYSPLASVAVSESTYCDAALAVRRARVAAHVAAARLAQALDVPLVAQLLVVALDLEVRVAVRLDDVLPRVPREVARRVALRPHGEREHRRRARRVRRRPRARHARRPRRAAC